MTAARTITPKKVIEFPEYLDFDRLRAEGITHIQAFAGKTWTDHNSHDPGITILELLCYALTDLGYRTNLDIRDLLAKAPSAAGNGEPDDNFPTAAHILSCNPLTILDLRKLLVDTPGVRNAWLKVVEPGEAPVGDEPGLVIDMETRRLAIADDNQEQPQVYVNGLYEVLLELDDAYLNQLSVAGDAKSNITDRILTTVNKKLQAHRNLCEDYVSIEILKDEYISLCGEIELQATSVPDDVMLDILDKVQEFLSPSISFYTLKEMLARGATTDQIFEGRPLTPYLSPGRDEPAVQSFGFVDTAQLEAAERRSVIHVSDIYRVLLDIKEVVAVKNLRLVNLTNGLNLEGEEWILPLTPDTFRPVLDARKSINSLVLSKRNVVYGVDEERVRKFFSKQITNRLKVFKKPEELDLPVKLGIYRNGAVNDDQLEAADGLSTHFSIQNELPAAYGTSAVAFPTRDTTAAERRQQAEALQLKGYLLFFDQLLANYLSQLGSLRTLYSTRLAPATSGVLSVGNMGDVPFLEKLLPYSIAPMPGNRITKYFQEGECIARVIDPVTKRKRRFGTPAERDEALRHMIEAFDNGTIAEDAVSFDPGYYHFIVKCGGIHPVVLLSAKTYATKEEAIAAFGLVRFLATLESSYVSRQWTPAEGKRYTFEWIFRWPTDFQDIMRRIVESESEYYQRKSDLFDHLLARFAEDFTDYTLLMFGLNKNSAQPPSLEMLVRNKAGFIDAYPDISRNRSRGVNQLTPSEKFWNWENISGLENRLSTMLGFRSKPTKQLNFFELSDVKRRLFFFGDRLLGGQALLQSPQPTRIGNLAGFQRDVKAVSGNAEAFRPIFCGTELVFGFKLADSNGCVLAVHPDTYGSLQTRDSMMYYTRLALRDADRLPVDFLPKQRGFYARVLSPSGKLLFRSVEAAPTMETARMNALAIRRAAANKDHYQPLARNSKGFGFQLRAYPKNAKTAAAGNILATHPTYYSSAEKRNDAITKTIHFFAENPLNINVHELPDRHSWEIQLANGRNLKSVHYFKTTKQTRAAAKRAMGLSGEAREVKIYENEEGMFVVRFIEHRTYADERPARVHLLLAQTEPVDERAVAEQLRDEILQLTDQYPARIGKEPEQYYAQLVSSTGEVWLRDVRLFPGADEAEIAFDEILEAACKGAWLPDDTINNGCAHGFSLLREGSDELLATHPSLYDNVAERNDVMDGIRQLSCGHRIRFEAEEQTDSWQFKLFFPNRDGLLSTILMEPADSSHATEAESRKFFEENVRKALVNFNADSIDPTGEAGNYSFQLVAGKVVVAEHPESYTTQQERDEVMKVVRECLKNVSEAFTEKLDTLRCTGDERALGDLESRRWIVRDANSPVAVNEGHFDTLQKATEMADQLITDYRCQALPYSELVIGEGAISKDNHWIIRNETKEMWQSVVTFSNPSEARQMFEKTLMHVIALSEDLVNYRIQNVIDEQTNREKFRIELTDERNNVIAVSGLFGNVALVQQEVGLRHQYARLFPFYETEEKIYFRLYDALDRHTDWRSARAYPTWQEAVDGFRAFIDMLGFEHHYAIVGDEAHGWQLVLIEVLLESARSFVLGPQAGMAGRKQGTENTRLDEMGWEQVETFLDSYQNTQQAKVANTYIDYTGGCGYRFRLVTDEYAVARHVGAFHTEADRESLRDELYLSCRYPAYIPGEAHDLLAEIKSKMDHFGESRQPLADLFVVIDGDVFLLGVFDKMNDQRHVLNKEYRSEDELVEAVGQVLTTLPANRKVQRSNGELGFEIRVVTGTRRYKLAGLDRKHAFPKVEIWESVASYKTDAEYNKAVDDCKDLLKDKANYSRYEAGDGSRVLMLTDPEQVLAIHPRRYESFYACSQAIERTCSYVDAEGFHLLEHILLRPRQATIPTRLLPVQVSVEHLVQWREADKSGEFALYIPGSDPYSMTATVVLPYWSRRFRSVDFRQFFENTLRRETPVHILLNIVWVTPEQMQIFEANLRAWLEYLAKPETPEFAARTDSLIEILAKLTNTFPHAVLNDCNGAPIILDQTTID